MYACCCCYTVCVDKQIILRLVGQNVRFCGLNYTAIYKERQKLCMSKPYLRTALLRYIAPETHQQCYSCTVAGNKGRIAFTSLNHTCSFFLPAYQASRMLHCILAYWPNNTICKNKERRRRRNCKYVQSTPLNKIEYNTWDWWLVVASVLSDTGKDLIPTPEAFNTNIDTCTGNRSSAPTPEGFKSPHDIIQNNPFD